MDTKSASGVTEKSIKVFGGSVCLLLFNPEVWILSPSVYSWVANRLMMERYAGTHHTLHVVASATGHFWKRNTGWDRCFGIFFMSRPWRLVLKWLPIYTESDFETADWCILQSGKEFPSWQCSSEVCLICEGTREGHGALWQLCSCRASQARSPGWGAGTVVPTKHWSHVLKSKIYWVLICHYIFTSGASWFYGKPFFLQPFFFPC